MESAQVWQNSLKEAQSVITEFLGSSDLMKTCEQFSEQLIHCFSNGGTVFSCGNGGSHCDAMHFAEELTGQFRKERKPLGALALGDASHMSCVANDYGFEHVFERQLQALAKPGDVLLCMSTSGNSKNQILTVEAAKSIGVKTISLLGKTGGQLKEISDLSIVVPANTSDRVQEIHIKLIHTVIECVERHLFPENY